jgi:hypothetical protein
LLGIGKIDKMKTKQALLIKLRKWAMPIGDKKLFVQKNIVKSADFINQNRKRF